MDTRLRDIEQNWTALHDLAAREAGQLESNRYHILKICNFTNTALMIALGYETDRGVVTKGWYRSYDCFVPVGVHTGETFYVRAHDDTGREVRVLQEHGRRTLCARRGSPFSVTNAAGDAACHHTGAGSGGMVTFAFSKIVTHAVVTQIVFGSRPKGISILGFRRNWFQDAEQGD